MTITWLGQGGYLFEHQGTRLAVDPYLSNSLDDKGFPRLSPSLMAPQQLNADYLVCTHDHGDHFDADTVIPAKQASPGTVVIGPGSVVDHGKQLDLSVALLTPGREAMTCGPFTVKAVPAYHSDPHSIGLLISAGVWRVYITGDSNYRESLAEDALVDGPIDLLLICINGKLNNMSYEEASKVAAAIKPGLTIPMHYGMFACNTIDPELFLTACRKDDLPCAALSVDQPRKLGDLLGRHPRPVEFRGVVPPVVTPLRGEALDEAGFVRLIGKLIEGGCSALFFCGTAGIGPALTDEQYTQVLSVARKAMPSGVPALAGVMEPATSRAKYRLRLAESLGYQYAVLPVPYFFVPRSDQEIVDHFRQCAEATSMSIIAYNLPQYTHCEIPTDLLVTMFNNGWISGVKESSGNKPYFTDLCKKAAEIGLPVFQGNRPDFSELSGLKAAGIVPVPANVQPELFVKAWETGSEELQQETDRLWDALVHGTDFLSGTLAELAKDGIG